MGRSSWGFFRVGSYTWNGCLPINCFCEGYHYPSFDENLEVIEGDVWAHSLNAETIYRSLAISKGHPASSEYMVIGVAAVGDRSGNTWDDGLMRCCA